MNNIWDESELVMRFGMALTMGLHETVEIQSASRERYIVIHNGMVVVGDNKNKVIKPVCMLEDIRNMVAWNNVR